MKSEKKSKKKRQKRDEYNLHFDDLLDEYYEEFMQYLYDDEAVNKSPQSSSLADLKEKKAYDDHFIYKTLLSDKEYYQDIFKEFEQEIKKYLEEILGEEEKLELISDEKSLDFFLNLYEDKIIKKLSESENKALKELLKEGVFESDLNLEEDLIQSLLNELKESAFINEEGQEELSFSLQIGQWFLQFLKKKKD